MIYLIIVNCIDMENVYKIKDEEGIEIIKRFHETKDFEKFKDEFIKYLKDIKDTELKENSFNLIKHLQTAKMFEWNCGFIIKKIKK